MENNDEFLDLLSTRIVIKVISVGSGGNNAIKHMLQQHIEGVELICVDFENYALKKSSAQAILMADMATRGLDGGSPERSKQAALEERERIMSNLEGTDLVFIIAGIGGNTGAGAAPVVAQIAKELGILTVAIITTPLPCEGRRRALIAEEGINALSQFIDSLIIIPSKKLPRILSQETTLYDLFNTANEILYSIVSDISKLFLYPQLIGFDFVDFITVMQKMNLAMIGFGYAKGDTRKACIEAFSNPLLEYIDLSNADGILIIAKVGDKFGISEFQEIEDVAEDFISENTIMAVGLVTEPEMSDEVRITVIAGLHGSKITSFPI